MRLEHRYTQYDLKIDRGYGLADRNGRRLVPFWRILRVERNTNGRLDAYRWRLTMRLSCSPGKVEWDLLSETESERYQTQIEQGSTATRPSLHDLEANLGDEQTRHEPFTYAARRYLDERSELLAEGRYIGRRMRIRCDAALQQIEQTLAGQGVVAPERFVGPWRAELQQAIAACNDGYVRARSGLLEQDARFSDLNERQREAVVREPDALLVNAGAGTGKTRTLIRRVRYLTEVRQVPPEQILVLTFSNEALNDVERQLEQQGGVRYSRAMGEGSVCVTNYHKLGLRILGSERDPRVGVASDAEKRKGILRSIVGALLRSGDHEVQRWLLHARTYLSFDEPRADDTLRRIVEKMDRDRQTRLQILRAISRHGHEEANGPRTIDRTAVKSYGEVFIYNWLVAHGFKVEYERPYPHPFVSSGGARRGYRPDFYLPEHDVWIEHFGVDEQGRPPSWFEHAEDYVRGMAEKRATHRQNGTKLVETTFGELRAQRLVDSLTRQLTACGIEVRPLEWEKLAAKIGDRPVFSHLVNLLDRFLSLFKSNGHDLDTLRERELQAGVLRRELAFLDLFERVLDRYEETMAEGAEVDFSDLILQSTAAVREDRFPSPFSHILIDEFQDITRGRMEFIRALYDQAARCGLDPKLFCVGDDWQSIYQFAGSDISLITDFESQFEGVERVDLEETHRFGQSMVDFSSAFIQKNEKQRPKSLRSARADLLPPVVVVASGDPSQGFTAAVDDLRRDLDSATGTAAVVTRYGEGNGRRAAGALHWSPLKPRRGAGHLSGLTLKSATVHGWKGLDDEVVHVIELDDDEFGFPSRIENDPVLDLVLPPIDGGTRFAEERRLFYVAVTRAEKRAYLHADPSCMSPFVDEVLTDPTLARYVEVLPRCGPCDQRLKPIAAVASAGRPDGPRMERVLRIRDQVAWMCATCGVPYCRRCNRPLVLRSPRQSQSFAPFFGCPGFSSKNCKSKVDEALWREFLNHSSPLG